MNLKFALHSYQINKLSNVWNGSLVRAPSSGLGLLFYGLCTSQISCFLQGNCISLSNSWNVFLNRNEEVFAYFFSSLEFLYNFLWHHTLLIIFIPLKFHQNILHKKLYKAISCLKPCEYRTFQYYLQKLG